MPRIYDAFQPPQQFPGIMAPGAAEQLQSYQSGQTPGYQLMGPNVAPSVRRGVYEQNYAKMTAPPAPIQPRQADPKLVEKAQREMNLKRRAGENDEGYLTRLRTTGLLGTGTAVDRMAESDLLAQNQFRPALPRVTPKDHDPAAKEQRREAALQQIAQRRAARKAGPAGPITSGSAAELSIPTVQDQDRMRDVFADQQAMAVDRQSSRGLVDLYHNKRKFDAKTLEGLQALSETMTPAQMRLVLDNFDEGDDKDAKLSDIEKFIIWPQKNGQAVFPTDPTEYNKLWEDARRRHDEFRKSGKRGTSNVPHAQEKVWTQEEIDAAAAEFVRLYPNASAADIRAHGQKLGIRR